MINLEKLMAEKPVVRKAVRDACERCGESDFDYLMEPCGDDPAARIIAGLQEQLAEQQESYELRLRAGGMATAERAELDALRKRVGELSLEAESLRCRLGKAEGEAKAHRAKAERLRRMLEPLLAPDVVGCDGHRLAVGDIVYGGDGTRFEVLSLRPTEKYTVEGRKDDGTVLPLRHQWLSLEPRGSAV